MSHGPGPERILSIGFGFRSAKALLSAVEIGVFDALADKPLDGTALARALGLAPRGAADFFDTLVAMRLLERDAAARYSNAPEAAAYLESGKPAYVGNHLAYLNAGQYQTWGRLTAALRDGKSQGGPWSAGGFEAFYEDPTAFEGFMNGMSAGIAWPARLLAAQFPWSKYRSFADVGTAQGCLPAEIASRHPHLTGVGFDLARVEPLFVRNMERRGVADRVRFVTGDFFADPLPGADVLILARVLHDWDPGVRRQLLAKAHDATNPGGALIVCETVIDDERRTNLHAFLASLNMLLMTAGGSESTAAELDSWMREAGFRDTSVMPLANGYCAVVGHK